MKHNKKPLFSGVDPHNVKKEILAKDHINNIQSTSFNSSDFSPQGIGSIQNYGDYTSIVNALNSWINSPTFLPTISDIIKKDGKEAGLAAAAEILKLGLAILPPPFPFGAAIISVLFYSSSQQDNLWNAIKDYVEATVSKRIQEYYTDTMVAHLSGIFDVVGEYRRLLSVYEKSKLTKEESPTAPILRKIDSLDDVLRIYLRELDSSTKYKYLSLPFYAQAANLHLLLLRDRLINGKEWGVNSIQLEGYKTEQGKLIKKYTDYVTETYKAGLEKEIERDGTDNGEDSVKDATDTDKWNRINAYKNTMTLGALDIVALFPLYDPEVYTKLPDVRQSRQLFSRLTGKPKYLSGTAYKDMSLNQINEAIAPDTKYNGELKQIDMWTNGNSSIVGNRIDAIQPYYANYTGEKIGGSLGNLTSITEYPRITGIIQTQEKDAAPVTTVTYLHQDGNEQKFGDFYSGGASNQNEYITNFLGVLSTVKAVGISAYAGGYKFSGGQVFGFRNSDIRDKHQLFTNIAVQIPAEVAKGSAARNSIPEIINGQNAILITPSTSLVTYTLISPQEQQYKVKYRIAANVDSSIGIIVPGQQGVPITQIIKTTATTDTITGEYGYYKLIDGPTVTLKRGENNVSIAVYTGTCALDRIELDPIVTEARIAYDNFDNERIIWTNAGDMEIIDSGYTGKAGKIGPNGNIWSYGPPSAYFESLLVPYTHYTMSAKLKLNSTNPNEKQTVQLITDNAKKERVIQEVELTGDTGYQEFKLAFITREDLINTHIGIKGTGGANDILFDDVEIIGVKRLPTTNIVVFSDDFEGPNKWEGMSIEQEGINGSKCGLLKYGNSWLNLPFLIQPNTRYTLTAKVKTKQAPISAEISISSSSAQIDLLEQDKWGILTLSFDTDADPKNYTKIYLSNPNYPKPSISSLLYFDDIQLVEHRLAHRDHVIKEQTTWDSNKEYNEGDRVLYNGNEYEAKYWTQGNQPDISDHWKLISDVVMEWIADKAYTAGEKIHYQGTTYQARWWTKGEIPSETEVWEKCQ